MEKFWNKVMKTDTCWLWIGAKRSGYGAFRDSSKIVRAHRKSWVMSFGEVPIGMNVLHKCDTPACVNPEHLFLGTQKENMHDMFEKGRARPHGCNKRP